MPRSCTRPLAIDVDQNTQRHVVCCVMKAPIMGPMAGPRRGASVYKPIDRPRCSAVQQSARTPPPVAKGALGECQLLGTLSEAGIWGNREGLRDLPSTKTSEESECDQLALGLREAASDIKS